MPGMKSSRAARADRRAHRKRHRDRDERAADLGLLEQLRSALDGLGPDAPWDRVAPRILPIIKRAATPFPSLGELLYVTVPPGIRTGFGVDLGPAFSHVDIAMVDRWGVSLATLLATSLDNLREATIADPPRVERITPDGVPVLAVQGPGWGSSLILAPDLLGPLIGVEPRILLTPVRNVLLAVPESAAPQFIEDLFLAVTDSAPDALDARILRWNGRAVVDLADRAVGLPN
jgi:hypothetical protein